jgi:hypothetical protein
MTMGLVLILVAFVLVLAEAFHVPAHPRVSWGWLGLALWLASLLVGNVRAW